MSEYHVLMRKLLDGFWQWAGIKEDAFSRGNKPSAGEPFDYPHLHEMREACVCCMYSDLQEEDIFLILSCMALDDEEEYILDVLKKLQAPELVERFVKIGVVHPQPNTRWQIAELLRCVDVPNRDMYLKELLSDENEYVRRRAENSLIFLKETKRTV